MKPDTITIVPNYLIISIWAYRMGVHFCNRIGVSLYGCNRISVSPSGSGRFMKPAANVGVVTSILTLYTRCAENVDRRREIPHTNYYDLRLG